MGGEEVIWTKSKRSAAFLWDPFPTPTNKTANTTMYTVRRAGDLRLRHLCLEPEPVVAGASWRSAASTSLLVSTSTSLLVCCSGEYARGQEGRYASRSYFFWSWCSFSLLLL